MKQYVKYMGIDELSGNYFTTGLTKDSYYEFIKITEGKNFVVVINDLGEEYAYSKELFEQNTCLNERRRIYV